MMGLKREKKALLSSRKKCKLGQTGRQKSTLEPCR